ncbi:GIY-YIG nuclease family protein [Brucella anthropi]|uniref:GIY-YIG nuclease family protein n=1 Tax=Brucella anthropi TaxID=529 RepID=UPI00244749FB|nr:GIY-YIG nuclease family protein [Brucella anthropi]MDH0367998.1 GIY-YIG nuclease family protein [Brucella anthropi]
MKKSPVVYFVQREDGRIKVGHTNCLPTRLKKLSGSHGKLQVLRVIEGGSTMLEKSIHKNLQSFNDFGEWFRECDTVIEAVHADYSEIATETDVSTEWAEGETRLRDEAQQSVQKMVEMRMAMQPATKEKTFASLSADYGIAHWTLKNLYIGRVSTVTAYTLEVVRAARCSELLKLKFHLDGQISGTTRGR